MVLIGRIVIRVVMRVIRIVLLVTSNVGIVTKGVRMDMSSIRIFSYWSLFLKESLSILI